VTHAECHAIVNTTVTVHIQTALGLHLHAAHGPTACAAGTAAAAATPCHEIAAGTAAATAAAAAAGVKSSTESSSRQQQQLPQLVRLAAAAARLGAAPGHSWCCRLLHLLGSCQMAGPLGSSAAPLTPQVSRVEQTTAALSWCVIVPQHVVFQAACEASQQPYIITGLTSPPPSPPLPSVLYNQ